MIKHGALVLQVNLRERDPEAKASTTMKRIGNIYGKICSMDNLVLAEQRARRGKRRQPGVVKFDQNPEGNLLRLQQLLVCKSYKTSEYTTFMVHDPKRREVFKLPYWPDRIAHHAVMNVLEPVFMKTFTADTYSCIKGKGIHGAAKKMKTVLQDIAGTQYCLKLDIRKFYPSVDHGVLKQLLRRKFKDNDLLHLLDEVIDSAPGLPIGNYLSQFLANFYLSYFDHWVKEQLRVKYYFRYADDIVILAATKEELHALLAGIKRYLAEYLKLEVKANYQVFPVDKRGIDFVGYVFYHGYTLLRKRIKQRFARMMAKNRNPKSLASYRGWTNHCNSYNLLKKLTHANNHQIIQLTKHHHRHRKRSFYRKEKRDGGCTRQTDNNSRLQTTTVKIPG